ncbi:hypothetical protein MNBD_IGNAVI01-3149 [hydrothermal vent metagenome]|uniref:TolB protein, periplasmic protein involved in the tonb-independent uptake of group A colicins n=1 Tax=hydrothermal vent metagenome TaxID=652676 RepID=A0A3B1CU42_9ZZZZ
MKRLKRYYITLFVLILSSMINLAQPKDEATFNDTNPDLKITSTHLYGEQIFFVKKKVVSNIVLGDIYSMNPDGSNVQQLTRFSDGYYITELPELSKDGTKLTFISNFESWKSAFYTDVFMADLRTGKMERITGFEKTSPAAKTATVNVTVADKDTFAITPSAIRISYSGCTNFIANNSASLKVPADEDIWIKAEVAKAKGDLKIIKVPAGGTETVRLDLTAGTISAESFDLSKDNNHLVVSTNSENIKFPFYTLGIWDTNTLKRIAEVGALHLGGDITPKYSPNGSMIAYGTGEFALNSLGIISTANLNSNPTVLVNGNRFGIQAFCSQPEWSPDGSEIVFVYSTINGLYLQSNLFKVSVNGGNPVQLTFYSGSEVVSKPTYSPDGTKIAYNLLRSKSNNTFTYPDLINFTCTSNIYYIPSNGGQAVSLTSDGASIDPSWGIVNVAVSVDNDTQTQPNSFVLYQNYPNPFNPSTKIKYTIPTPPQPSPSQGEGWGGVCDIKSLRYTRKGSSNPYQRSTTTGNV